MLVLSRSAASVVIMQEALAPPGPVPDDARVHVAGLTHATPGPWTAVREGVAASRLARVVALVLVCAAGGALRLANFAAVPTTPFYDAAVRSMGLSWHNFFYGALDPSGWLAIDKPPLDLWLQVASTKLFGFSSVALRLPPALAGILVIPLLYDLVRRGFGRGGGSGGGGRLRRAAGDGADQPVGHDGHRDGPAARARGVADRPGGAGAAALVVAAGAAAGLAFEIKLTEAMVALPALVLLAWLALEEPAARKRRTLALAGGAFAVAASMWAVAASLLPGRHPFAYGSPDGSIWQMILVYNGISPARQSADVRDAPGPFRLFDPSGAALLRRADRERSCCARSRSARSPRPRLRRAARRVRSRGCAARSAGASGRGWSSGSWWRASWVASGRATWRRSPLPSRPRSASASRSSRRRRAAAAARWWHSAVVALVAVVAGRATGGSATANVGRRRARRGRHVRARRGLRDAVRPPPWIAAAGCGVLLAAVLAVPLATSVLARARRKGRRGAHGRPSRPETRSPERLPPIPPGRRPIRGGGRADLQHRRADRQGRAPGPDAHERRQPPAADRGTARPREPCGPRPLRAHRPARPASAPAAPRLPARPPLGVGAQHRREPGGGPSASGGSCTGSRHRAVRRPPLIRSQPDRKETRSRRQPRAEPPLPPDVARGRTARAAG